MRRYVLIVWVLLAAAGCGRTAPFPAVAPSTASPPAGESPSAAATATAIPSPSASAGGSVEGWPRGPSALGGDSVARFTSEGVGWRVANQRVYRTSDAGQTWTQLLDTHSDISALNGSSWFSDDRSAVVLSGDTGQGFVLDVTRDAGASWQQGRLPATPFMAMPRLFFATPDDGWALFPEGLSPVTAETLHHTTDGGATWSTVMRSGPGPRIVPGLTDPAFPGL